ncbi:MAG: YbhB/YbcL family Raf kinase inhibitor-like protein [Deltaproteobacteria bacterium]|uniref:YbhB/YbcL family Raf kinase inhibitor-like protein n=1 Tax=Candidatus Zymogenus saltonus TaxID=2844893 RepID=A0A9D8KDJ7_9DELT|nr:YbhB/YbcL family Raf kinase inhibitor-like protein [Candidatus Zymogenus saltonus]
MKRNTFPLAPRPLFVYVIAIIILLTIPLALTGQENAKLKLESPVFKHMGNIPVRYTCDGDNVSPPLVWSGIPEGCVSMVIIMEDPDAEGKTMTHWLVWNLDPNLGGLEEGILLGLVKGFTGVNDFSKHGYVGPCLESGSHVYQIKLYALKEKIELTTASSKTELMAAMEGKIIATSTLMGVYGK